jgi:hypothetical protein
LYDEINLMNIPEEVIHLSVNAPEVEAINESKENPILQMINNQISNYLNEYLQAEKINLMPKLENYFTYSEIKTMFKNYKEL